MKNDIGVMVNLRAEGSVLKYVHDFGLKSCQLCCWNETLYTDERAAAVKREAAEMGIEVTSLWAGWPGPAAWNFTEGPATLGIVPEKYRPERMAALKAAGPFAVKAGLPAVVTHLGFIPEAPSDQPFKDVVALVRELAEGYKKLGLEFWFETGQETPTTMLRLIQAVGTGNLGVNLDPANLLLYGMANPIDSLLVFGKYVRGIHAKDGHYPTDPMQLGREVKVGEGLVRFPEFVKRLTEIGYEGAYIIEREIGGEQQNRDIAETVEYLRGLLGH